MKILIIDDDKAIRYALKELLTNENYEVIEAVSGEDALDILKNQTVEICIVDYQLPGMNGLELLSKIKKEYSNIQIIFITAFGNLNTAITAIKNGAYDYVAKPFDNDELINRLNHIKKSILNNSDNFNLLYGYYFSNTMKSIITKIQTIARTDVPVLITGESGTGKELIAKLTHYHSERSGKFVTVNCSALPSTLIESELFGAEKGSYTGAYKTKIGFFEQADGGTIFLDEIGDMPVDLQAKLLRVLQEEEIYRVGSSMPIKINSRIIAATNINIEEQVKNKKFREDLFYRLNGIRLEIPPLRERKEEIKLLSQMFLEEFNNKYNKIITGFDEKIINLILEYAWPGNIRELKSKIEETVIFCNSDLIRNINLNIEKSNNLINNQIIENKPDDSIPKITIENIDKLPTKIIEAKKIIIENFEKDFISFYLKKNNNKVSKVAEEIGLYRQDLYKKIKKFNIINKY